MRKNQAFTLVETLIAITIFSVLSAAAASLMLSSINLRENNQDSLRSEQFIKQVLERHKDYWAVKSNYDSLPTYISNYEFTQDMPETMSMNINYQCLDAEGNLLGSGSGALNCSKSNPPLRRVIIEISRNGSLVAKQKADIGRPISNGN